MYNFAVVALLGLVTLAVIAWLEGFAPDVVRFRALLTLVLGVVIAFAIDYSMFRGFHVHVREEWMGTAGTGLIIGSLATVWRALLGYLGFTEDKGRTDTRADRPRMAA